MRAGLREDTPAENLDGRKRLVIYTAISGAYDSLKPVPDRWRAEADCIAYVEGLCGEGWTTCEINADFEDGCRNAKRHKIVPHELFGAYEYSIWIDGSVILKPGLSALDVVRASLQTHDLAVFRHRKRDCIYQEAQACIDAGKDAVALIERQVARYRAEGYPQNNGLSECTVLIRRHTPAVIRFCEAWYAEILAGSRRDQLSFNYVAHRQNFRYQELPGTIIDNPYFIWVYHDPTGGPLVPVVEL
jgi:hypothetical protein